ncbi:MAG: NADP-dependent malic enzyme [Candidatus Diapherotrites archaeon]
MDFFSESLKMHEKLKGKIELHSKIPVDSREALSIAYTPGVAQACKEIAANPSRVFDLTLKSNSVAVVSDGSAVLGLGNIGAEAAIPVMEGKSVLFKEFAGVDAFPICLKTQDSAEIIETVKRIAPVFGGINLEDISAPRCFEIEAALQDLGIPVFHDDQHGTAIVVRAALINALKVVGKKIEGIKIVVNGAGAAGTAVARLLKCFEVDSSICFSAKEVIVCDSKGAIFEGREGLNPAKQELAKITNSEKLSGSLADALKGADAFIGVSVANVVSKEMVKSMNEGAIVLAMANPVPEIMPQDAIDAGAAVVGTGRSDFPNQINNVLAFPGVFRGALDSKATKINNEMKIAASNALAECVPKPSKDRILPYALEKDVAKKIAEAVAKAAKETGVVRN